MSIAFAGTIKPLTEAQVETLVYVLGRIKDQAGPEFVTHPSARGSARQARYIAGQLRYTPRKKGLPPREGERIVEQGDFVIIAPAAMQPPRGHMTARAILRARRNHQPGVIIWPDGNVAALDSIPVPGT